MLSNAISDVFRERASREYSRIGNCRETFLQAFKALGCLALPVLVGSWLLAPDLFALVLGAEWRQSGEYVQIMAPFLALRLLVSPLSFVVYVAEMQHWDLAWQTLVFLSVVIAFWLGGTHSSVTLALGLFTALYSALYLVYLWMNYSFARRNK
jgi:O-antigen/teichoic acid export membrane protein